MFGSSGVICKNTLKARFYPGGPGLQTFGLRAKRCPAAFGEQVVIHSPDITNKKPPSGGLFIGSSGVI